MIAVFVIIIALIAGRAAHKTAATNTVSNATRVVLVSAQTFAQNNGTTSASGTVQSLQQAQLSSQVSEPVTKIYVSVGSHVSAGQALIALKSADVNAQLSQAEAALDAQKAALAQLVAGSSSQQVQVAQTAVNSAQQTLATTQKQQQQLVTNANSALLNSTFAAVPSTGNTSTATVTVGGDYTGTATGTYKITVGLSGEGYTYSVSGLESATGIISRGVTQPFGSMGLSLTFSPSGTLNTGDYWVVAVPNTLAPNYLQNYSAYQAAQTASQSAITAAQNALQAAQAQLALQEAGATDNQVQQQQANVASAQANVQNLEAQLSKTVITSPIDGTVSSVAVKYGELVNIGEVVVSVVNQGGLEVKAFISSDDLSNVKQGDPAVISTGAADSGASVSTTQATITGSVLNISPSIDPTTKTVEVDILIANSAQSGLVVGQNVSVSITPASAAAAGASTTAQPTLYLLPIQAVDVTPNGSYVYTVDSNSKIVQNQVTTGSVEGEDIQVTGGLTPTMNIVSAVYQLEPGEQVTTQ